MEDERFKVEGEWGKGKSERLKGFRTKCKTALIESCRIHVHVEIREIMFTLTESMTKDICRDLEMNYRCELQIANEKGIALTT